MADRMIVELYCMTTGDVLTRVTVPDGSPAALTGAIDLPAGDHEICIRMYPESPGGTGDWSGAGLQVIVGQMVDEQSCIGGGGGAG